MQQLELQAVNNYEVKWLTGKIKIFFQSNF